MRKFLGIGVAAVLVCMLAGCGKAGIEESQSGSGGGAQAEKETEISAKEMPPATVNIAINENIVQLDPHNQSNLPGYMMWSMCMEPLILEDRKGNYDPLLCESWEHDEAGLEWTFRLRQGIKYHNGEDFNADDVMATFDRLLSKRNELQNAIEYWTLLDKCEKVDDYTVKFTYSQPDSTALLSFSNTPIIPNEAYAEYGDDLWNKQMMYGTGPWVFQEWSDGQFTHFIKNTNYWNQARFNSYYDEVYLRHITELSTSVAGHIAGDLQVNLKTGGIDTDLLGLYSGTEDRIQMVDVQSGMYNYIGFQCAPDKVFHDKNARLAFEYAIDRQSILDNILGGAGKVPNGIINDSCVGFDASIPPYEYDPDKAKEYLGKSDYDGRKITIVSNTSTKKAEETLLAISENMNAAGFNTDILVTEPSTMLEMRKSGNYDLFYVGNMHNAGDPCQVLNLRILNDVHKSNYVNEEMNELIKKIKVEMDADTRNGYVSQVSHMIREEAAPHSAIVQMNLKEAIDYGVTGIDLFTDGNFRTTYVTYDPSLVP